MRIVQRNNGLSQRRPPFGGAPGFDAPDPGNPATRRGLVKFAFFSPKIEDLYASVQLTDTVIRSTLETSNRTGGLFFIVLDPDGNWIQIFGPEQQYSYR